jgi:hypothetical protein
LTHVAIRVFPPFFSSHLFILGKLTAAEKSERQLKEKSPAKVAATAVPTKVPPPTVKPTKVRRSHRLSPFW